MNDPVAIQFMAEVLASLRSTRSGRNRAIFRASAKLGELVGAARLSRDEVESHLRDAAEAIGSMVREKKSSTYGAIRRGLNRGELDPLSENGTAGTSAVRRPAPLPPPVRPPQREITALWEGAVPLTQDADALAWCRLRGLDAAVLEDWDAARVVPAGWKLWRWARSGGISWNETGHRLLVRLFDADLRCVSLRARRIREDDGPKDLTPAGFEVRGSFMADGLALRVLAGDVPAWWTRQFAVQEGTPDFLSRVALQSDGCEDGPAVLGVFEGSWTPALADRFAAGTEINVRDHADSTGQSHVQRISDSVGDRCDVYQINRDSRANSRDHAAI